MSWTDRLEYGPEVGSKQAGDAEFNPISSISCAFNYDVGEGKANISAVTVFHSESCIYGLQFEY